ncbi:hypothetical protein EYR38_000790 [Pleurotus pulmonarius]|nr:hypothetical protein EYR38_000790 [Pleurotus pulmonarius]
MEESEGAGLQEWNSLQEKQTALFIAATTEIEASRLKLQELERELSVWKIAHKVVSDEKDALVKKASRLEQEIGKWTGDKPLIVALIDGDGHLFTQDLFSAGQAGGRMAATLLREALLGYVADKHPGIANRSEILLTIFWNGKGLKETLMRNNVCTWDEFDGFCHGFNQSTHLFSIVDAGNGKEAADTKIKEHLRLFTHFPQTELVFFGGGHDNGYTSTLTSLETEGLLHKVVLVRGYSDLAQEIRHLKLTELSTTGIFMTKKLISSPIKANNKPLPLDFHSKSPSSSSDVMSLTETPGGGNDQLPTSPRKAQSNVMFLHLRSVARAHTPSGKAPGPKPCNFYYLHPGRCQKRDCRFAHDMNLSDAMIDRLRAAARKNPCTFENAGKCTDKNCIWGHYCPQGTSCQFQAAPNGCKFRGAQMHSKPRQTTNTNDIIDSLGLNSISFANYHPIDDDDDSIQYYIDYAPQAI